MNEADEGLLKAARELAERLESAIILCRTRDEHIRVTARANEAQNLLFALEERFLTN